MQKFLGPLLAALECRETLSGHERQVIFDLGWRLQDVESGIEIVEDRSRPIRSCLLVHGMAGRSMSLATGERQISAIQVAGDFVDLHGFLLKVLDHSVVTLTRCTVAFVEHSALRALTEAEPHLGRMLSMLIAIDASIQRGWILALGRENASQRLAHLLCELCARLEVVGLASGRTFDLPFTQAQLADMLGLSVVHTNRVVNELRASKLVDWKDGRVTICDWRALAAQAQFDPVYLNLFHEPR